jgi:organic hydroperoxide reductase OsmC/OhrA
MGEHKAVITWSRKGADFTDGRYSRGHEWEFDGGVTVPASASPHVVPPPLSVPAAVDPEEAFVAAISSCHMLWFLSIAANRGFVVESYRDEAVGVMAKNPEGKLAMTRVTLRPAIRFAGDRLPSREEVETMHHESHGACFIASSVKTDVRCLPTWDLAPPPAADRHLARS